MKRNGAKWLAGLVILLIAVFACCSAAMAAAQAQLTADRDEANVGEEITFTYSVTGAAPDQAIRLICNSYMDEKTYESNPDFSLYYEARIRNEVLSAESGTFTVTVPPYGEHLRVQVNIGSFIGAVKLIDINGANWKPDLPNAVMTFSPDVPKTGEEATLSWNVTGLSGAAFRIVPSIYYYYDDDPWADGAEVGESDDIIGSFTAETPEEAIMISYELSLTDFGPDGNETLTFIKKTNISVYRDLAIEEQPASVDADSGDSVIFSVRASGNGLRYQWQYRKSSTGSWKNTSASGCTTGRLTVPATESRNGYQYRCTVTDEYGNQVNSKAATLMVRKPSLTIVTQPAGQRAENGTDAVFSVQAAGKGLQYQWQYRKSSSGTWKNSPAAGADTDTLMISATASKNGYQYRCVITDQAGQKVNSKAATLKVFTALALNTQPADQTVTDGTAVKFTVEAAGDGLQYQWQYKAPTAETWKNNKGTAATLSLSGTLSRNGYQYRCVITDQYNEQITSDPALLTVEIPVLTITSQPRNKTAEDGTTAKFTVKASGNGLTYQWQYKTPSGDWKNNSGTSATLSVSAAAKKNGYQYRCVITDKYDATVTSEPAVLTVTATLKITAQPANKSVTKGSNAKFTVKATGLGLKYQWQYRTSSGGSWKNTNAKGAATATLTVSATAKKSGYQYRCVITDQDGNTVRSKAATLTVK